MLQLSKEQLIGKGWHRECYQHPDDSHLCIKVVVNGDDTETKREQAYYRHLGRHLTNWEAIPRFYENVTTNLGQGAVFDLVHDNDGNVSKTLGYYLEEPERYHANKAELKSALNRLKRYQLQHNVLTLSLKPNNFLLQLKENGTYAAYIIDNLGNAELFPISSYFRYFSHRKIERKWRNFQQLLQKQHGAHDAQVIENL